MSRGGPVALVTVTAILLMIAAVVVTRAPTSAVPAASTPVSADDVAPRIAASPSPTDTPVAPQTSAAEPSPTLPIGNGWVPVSAGKAPEAGILYVQAGNDRIYRYDGTTGELRPVSARSIFVRETTRGVEILGRHGSADLLRWDGTVDAAICGEGTVVAIAPTGACAYREQHGAIAVRLPGERERREILPASWGAGEINWDPSGTRLAVTRSIPGATFDERAHNALWLVQADGSLRELYRPAEPTAFVFRAHWSPDGRWLTVYESPLISNSVAADGVPLLLVEAATGRTTRLGVARSPQWSASGALAFVRGAGRQTWMDKRLVVRSPDGSERALAVPDEDHVQLAPVWAGDSLAFVVGPAGSIIAPDYMAGVGVGARYGMILAPDGKRTEMRCPSGVVEGLRPSADGASYLVLCRAPGNDPRPLSIWWWRTGSSHMVPLLTGIVGTPIEAGGFGFYGAQPSLLTLVVWSGSVR